MFLALQMSLTVRIVQILVDVNLGIMKNIIRNLKFSWSRKSCSDKSLNLALQKNIIDAVVKRGLDQFLKALAVIWS